jgi:pimeloyl-ACP methyl ester carboxylesterase
MHVVTDANRRRSSQFVGASAAGRATTELGLIETAQAQKPVSGVESPMRPIRQVRAGVLEVGYSETGPSDGRVVLLLHGWPYDIHDYIEVAPLLAAQGYRVIVPHLRGHGSTRFLDAATPRSGQQAAIGVDVIALMDALKIPTAVLAGYDWGGRAACVVAALWPERCAGLVSVNNYLIQDIAHAGTPLGAVAPNSLEIGNAFRGSVVRYDLVGQPTGWDASVNTTALGRYPDRDLAMRRVEQAIENDMGLVLHHWELYRARK